MLRAAPWRAAATRLNKTYVAPALRRRAEKKVFCGIIAAGWQSGCSNNIAQAGCISSAPWAKQGEGCS